LTQHPAFSRVLGRFDLVLFSVSAILAIDTLASAASMGVTWFSWWVITMVVFFIPYGLMTAELGSAWPDEGGLYVWVREALGPRWGSLAAWFYWINNAYWVPSVYMIFAGTFDSMFIGSGNVWLHTGIAIVITWLTVVLGIVRLSVSKWIPNLGAAVKTAILVGLGVMGFAALFSGRAPANDFSLARFVPRWGDSLAFLPVLLYNTLGFELMSSAGEEMKDPQRDVPFTVLAAGLAISVVYALGSFGILFAIPLDQLSKLTGTWDALQALGRQWGPAGDTLVLLLGIGFLYAAVANIVTWSLGCNRVAAAAALEGALPRVLGRLHPKYNTPHMAFVIMGTVATVLLLGNAALAGRSDNVFWMIFKLSGVCFLVTYLLVFPAFLVLRETRPEQPRNYVMPGGRIGAWGASLVCSIFIAGATLLFFWQSPESENPWFETALLLGETLLTLVVGLWLMPKREPGPSPAPGA